MIRRTTWVVLVVFLAMLGAAIYVQRTNEGKIINEPTPTMAPALFDIQENTVKSLQISDNSGGRVELEQTDGAGWTLTYPIVEATDSSLAQSSVSELLSMKSIATLDPAPPADATGLATAAYTITISLQDGKSVMAKVGKITPTGSGYYLVVDDGPVVVVSKYSVEEVTNLISNPPVLATLTPEATTPEPATLVTETPLPVTSTPAPTATAAIFAPTVIVAPGETVTATLTATVQATP